MDKDVNGRLVELTGMCEWWEIKPHRGKSEGGMRDSFALVIKTMGFFDVVYMTIGDTLDECVDNALAWAKANPAQCFPRKQAAKRATRTA